MAKSNLFDPNSAAALSTKPTDEGDGDKDKPKPTKKHAVQVAPIVITDFPKPGDPYWKQHPLVTEHKDGSLRQWGEDSTQMVKNPNVLPKQMPPPTLDLSDKAKGYSNNYYRKNQ